MNIRKIKDSVFQLGAVDWDRRLFDSLIPLPDGTSYNAYLVKGTEKTALVDTADPAKVDIIMEQLSDVVKIDYIVAQHAEQDHSGSIPQVLAKYPEAIILASPKCKPMLVDHLHLAENKIRTVADGEKISLGSHTLEFIHTPWVHWPETMCTFVHEEKILFSCDFFGAHLATSDLFAQDDERVYEAAKRYYAEIMMPFRGIIRKNIDKISNFPVEIICPSHGPAYKHPSFIINAYKDWISETPKNNLVVAYISMHNSTRILVDHLVASCASKGVFVQQFDLSVTDIGKLAIALVDAATVVLGTPTVHVGAHPHVLNAANLANSLRPKLKFASIIGSYGWATKAVEQLASAIGALKLEIIPPVLCKGMPTQQDIEAIESLALEISKRHATLAGVVSPS